MIHGGLIPSRKERQILFYNFGFTLKALAFGAVNYYNSVIKIRKMIEDGNNTEVLSKVWVLSREQGKPSSWVNCRVTCHHLLPHCYSQL